MTGGAYTESQLVKRSGWLRLRAWIVCAAGMVAVLIGGSVTNRMSFGVAAVTLATPVAIFVGFGVAEWLEARRTGVVLPRGHLAGAGIAVVLWFLHTAGGGGDLNFGKKWYCQGVIGDPAVACLRDAAQALHRGHVVSWTGLAIVACLALLARRSRIAAWSTIAVVLAGQTLAVHFLLPLKGGYGL
jgi:hypothetical protein